MDAQYNTLGQVSNNADKDNNQWESDLNWGLICERQCYVKLLINGDEGHSLIKFGDKIMAYCPYSYKWQLVDWAVLNKGFRRSTANRMTKRQLYAIWYKS